MAKESMKAREVKRAKMCAKYAEKRKALKEAGDWAALDKLPKNSSPCRQLSVPSAQPLLDYGPSEGLHAFLRPQPYSVP